MSSGSRIQREELGTFASCIKTFVSSIKTFDTTVTLDDALLSEEDVQELTREATALFALMAKSPSVKALSRRCNALKQNNVMFTGHPSAYRDLVQERKSVKDRQQTPGKPAKRTDDADESDEGDENSYPRPGTMVKTFSKGLDLTATHSLQTLAVPLATNQKPSFVPPSAMRACRPQVKPSPSPQPSLTPDSFLLSPSILALQSRYNDSISTRSPAPPPSTDTEQVGNDFSGFPQLLAQASSIEDDTRSLWNQVIRSNGIPTPFSVP